MAHDLILGTAGHIDHGKTSLIRALTGAETDRLPEEKRRGITIDLGFAELSLPPYRLGLVDVPGHERFVRNMLAGATGMDLAMLVVAADDSVNQQTREHLDILRMLDLKGGVIALTKCDLAEPSWLELVEEEVRELVAGTPLADAPVVRTSVVTGMGIDALRDALFMAGERAATQLSDEPVGPFRMAIDRTFSVAGHGTVVTGSITSGRVRVGDNLSIEPLGRAVRVRGLQSHDRAAEELHRGQRGAINLAGVHHDEIERGQELCTPGSLVPAWRLTGRLRLLPDAPPLTNRHRVRLHVGTAEVLAAVHLLEGNRLSAGESALVQFQLATPAVTTWNQPFVVRRESPVATIGGGRILQPTAKRIKRIDADLREQLLRLETGDALERAGATLYLAGLGGWRPEDLPRLAAAADTALLREKLLASGELVEIPTSPTSVVRLHRDVLAQLGERIAALLAMIYEREPLRIAIPRNEIAAHVTGIEPAVLDAALRRLTEEKRIESRRLGFVLAGHGPKLSRTQEQLLEQILEWFRNAGLETPGCAEITAKATRNKESVPQLLEIAAGSGQLVAIGPDYWLATEVEQAAREKVAQALSSGNGLTLSEIRGLLGTTRKYAVPLCEYWDKAGFTARQGDSRVLAHPTLAAMPPK